MGLLLHAITLPEADAARAEGLRGQPLVYLQEGALAAWATEFYPLHPDPPSAPDQFERVDLMRHHEVVSWIHTRVEACLPARFPTWLSPEILRDRREELSTALERVRGRSELAVTALWTELDVEDPPPAATPGARYLLGRRQALHGSDRMRARASDLADEIERFVGNEVVEVQRQLCPSTVVALSMALLVNRSSAEALKSRLPRGDRDVRILVNGPWPPYTFAAVR